MHTELISEEIRKKLKAHQLRDSRLRQSTMTFEEALELLKSQTTCKICDCTLQLHSWEKYSESQFSFDRLDDSRGHTADNIQITCYKCNVNKAKKMYRPNMSKLDEYNKLRDLYFKTRNPIMVAALADLHDRVYGDRKPNGWRKK